MQYFTISSRLGLITLLLGLVAGCSGSNAVPVNGTVTIDGAPLTSGSIAFQEPDGKGPGATAVIRDGKYEASVAAGPKRVQIYGPTPPAPTGNLIATPFPAAAPRPVFTVPARYNIGSQTVAEVKADSSALDFRVTSQ